jgi:hypothetical protein
VSLYDRDEQVLGYVRTIFTPVACVSGACKAIRFSLVYDADLTIFDVFNPPGTDHPFKKYRGEEYLDFASADHSFLRNILLDPPDILVALPDQESLVEGTYATAPTRLEYQDVVVRGAAFTSYVAMSYAIETEDVLYELDAAGLLSEVGQ